MLNRLLRWFLGLALAASAAVILAAPVVTVYMSPECGCCGLWVDHLKASGFAVRVHAVEDVTPFKRKLGVPERLASCHSAVVNGYVIEGHVPAADIRRLLAEKPKARGLAVPGMPHGSPGMESGRNDPYDVLLFQANGRTSVYRSYNR